MKKLLSSLLATGLLLCGLSLAAADLTIDFQMNTTGPDYPSNYLTFKGKAVTADKDQYDVVTSASKLESTAMFNVYRFDVQGGKTLPGALRGLFLYPVADDGTRTGDGLTVTKAADGTITVRYVHRGTANEIVTDKAGKLVLPVSIKTRKIGHTDNLISADFSPTGKAADVNWAKVWDASLADGKVIGSTTSKTGKITPDEANSTWYVWVGALQFSFDGKVLKIAGELNAQKK
jgi:hypothetical protein